MNIISIITVFSRIKAVFFFCIQQERWILPVVNIALNAGKLFFGAQLVICYQAAVERWVWFQTLPSSRSKWNMKEEFWSCNNSSKHINDRKFFFFFILMLHNPLFRICKLCKRCFNTVPIRCLIKEKEKEKEKKKMSRVEPRLFS